MRSGRQNRLKFRWGRQQTSCRSFLPDFVESGLSSALCFLMPPKHAAEPRDRLSLLTSSLPKGKVTSRAGLAGADVQD